MPTVPVSLLKLYRLPPGGARLPPEPDGGRNVARPVERAAVRPALLAGAVLLLAACSQPAPEPEAPRAVRTVTVSTGAAVARREFPAELRARTESRLGFRVEGKLLRRPAQLGEAVRAGQLLAELDAADLQLAQQSAIAAAQSAQAALDQAEAELRRYRDLRAQGFISGAELDRRELTVQTARAQRDQAQAQSRVQANQSGYTRLLADVSGVVTAIEAEPGAVLGKGATVLRLAHDGPRDAVFSVPEDRVADWRALLGRPGVLRLRLWGDSDAQSHPLVLRELAAAADPVTRTFLAKADVGAAPVRIGQTATVLLDLPVPAGVVKLPLAAVFEQQGRSVVWRVDPQAMTVQTQPVQVAGAEGNLVLVSGGLADGQVVVTAGVHVLTPGQKVRYYQAPSPAAAAPVTPVGR